MEIHLEKCSVILTDWHLGSLTHLEITTVIQTVIQMEKLMEI